MLVCVVYLAGFFLVLSFLKVKLFLLRNFLLIFPCVIKYFIYFYEKCYVNKI